MDEAIPRSVLPSLLLCYVAGVLLGSGAWLSYCLLTRSTLRRLIRDSASALERHKVQYWADYGTLLGIVREKDAIIGDTDVDYTVPVDDESNRVALKAALEWLHGAGYHIEHLPQWREQTFTEIYRAVDPAPSYSPIPGKHVDFYLTTLDGRGSYTGTVGKNMEIPASLVKEITSVAAQVGPLNVTVKIPDRVGDVLEWRYGSDYHIRRPGHKGRDAPPPLSDKEIAERVAAKFFVFATVLVVLTCVILMTLRGRQINAGLYASV